MPEDFVKENLEGLKKEYEDQGMKIEEDEGDWQMVLEEEMVPEVRKVVKPEFSKAVLKTLATIAVNEPVKQSKIVKIRGNKSYNHINELEGRKFIKSEPFKRTRKLRLTEKFSDYFQMEKNKIKKKLKETDGVEKVKK